MSSVGGRLDSSALAVGSIATTTTTSAAIGSSTNNATAGYHLPTSLDFINRPNPIEPHAESQKHPLNGVSAHHRDVVVGGSVGPSGGGNAIGSTKSGATASSSRATEHALNHILLPERDLHLGPSSTSSAGDKGAVALHLAHHPHPHPHQHPHHPRRRKASTDISNLDLPRLPERRAQKRMRIPPTVAGLYQPPPESGILPRIDPGDASTRPPPAARGASFPGLSTARKAIDAGMSLAPSVVESVPVTTETSVTRNISAETPTTTTQPAEPTGATPTDKPSSSTDPARRPSYWKPPLRRNMWTEEETGDLLKGVAKFGIGAWTKILKCPDYHFNRRTALDLKDRFRVTCPEQYVSRKPRGSKDAPAAATWENSGETSPAGASGATSPPASTSSARGGDSATATPSCAASTTKPRSTSSSRDAPPSQSPTTTTTTSTSTQRITPAKLSQLGISTPFTKTRRRARHGYTDAEDAAILKGYRKYNGSWASIRDDPELALSHRTATDLRDRMRNRYPEEYRKSGRLKISEKPSDASKRPKEKVVGEVGGEEGKENRGRNSGVSTAVASAALPGTTAHAPEHHLSRHTIARSTTLPSATNAPALSTNLFPTRDVFFGAPFREQEDHEYADVDDGDDAFPGGELITLDRDILNWATSATTTTTAAAATTTTTTTLGIPPILATSVTTTTPSGEPPAVLTTRSSSASSLLGGTGAVDPRETVLQNNTSNTGTSSISSNHLPRHIGLTTRAAQQQSLPSHPVAAGGPGTSAAGPLRSVNFLAALPSTTSGAHVAAVPPPQPLSVPSASSTNSLPPLATLVRPGGALNGAYYSSSSAAGGGNHPFAGEDLELPSLMQW